MASISGCAKADEADLAGQLTPVIGVGDEENTVAELIEWPRLKGFRVEYPTGSNRFREFCKAKSSIDGIWGHALAYRGNFFKTCSVSQGGDYLYLLPDLAQEKKCRWAASGSEKRITAKDFLEYYAVKYVTATDGAYLSSSSSRPCFFDLSSAGRVWNDNLLWVSGECLQRSDEEPLKLNHRTITKGINCKVSRKESFIDVVAREGTELEAVLKELEISRFKSIASKDDKVRIMQAKQRLAGKTPGSMEEKLSTPELNTSLKLARLNEILDGPVDVATIFGTVVRNLAKRKAIKRGVAPHSVTSVSVDNCSKRRKFVRALRDIQLGFKDRSMELEKRISQLEGEKNQLEENLIQERGAFQLEREKEREAVALKLKEVRAESEAEAKRLVFASAISRNNLAGKLYQLRTFVYVPSVLRPKLVIVGRPRRSWLSRALNEEISNMKCNIRALNKQLLKREIELDTARTNLAASESDFEKLSSSIMGKDRELRNSAQIRNILIARLDRVKADLHRLKGRKTQSRADLAEIQAKNKSLVDDLAHARGSVRRVVQREKEMNERINQLCARISELEREIRVREMKYQKDLKIELDKRDGEIASGEGSREMKEFLRRKEDLVENMRIDLTNSRQKLIDVTRQMSERIDQLTAKLAKSKARRLKDNKRAAVTHQSFKEIVVHEQEAIFCRGIKIPAGRERFDARLLLWNDL
ncbi:hypothetical protein GIB67_032239, partial [Kingdonia uniflora]